MANRSPSCTKQKLELAQRFLDENKLRVTVVYAGRGQSMFGGHRWFFLFRDAEDRAFMEESSVYETNSPATICLTAVDALSSIIAGKPVRKPIGKTFGEAPTQKDLERAERDFKALSARFQSASRFFSPTQMDRIFDLQEQIRALDEGMYADSKPSDATITLQRKFEALRESWI